MAISKLSIPQYVENVSAIHADDLNAIISKVNELVDAANGSSSGGGTTPTAPSAPTITINGTSATISAVSGATIKYTIDGSNPSASVGTTYSGAITLSASCTIKAVAIKDGLVSSVATKTYTAPVSIPTQAETTAILSRYTKSISNEQQSAFNEFIYNLKQSGLYGKMRYVVLPFLAADKTEATQNALSGESAFKNGSVDGVLFSNNGIKAIVGATASQLLMDADGDKLKSTNFHFSAYNNNSLTDNEFGIGQDLALGCTVVEVGKSMTRGGKAGLFFQKTGSPASRTILANDANLSKQGKTHFIGSLSTNSQTFCVSGSATTESLEVQDKYINSYRAVFGANVNTTTYLTDSEIDATTKGTSRFNYGLLTWGLYLSESECIAFNGYVETMMAKFIS